MTKSQKSSRKRMAARPKFGRGGLFQGSRFYYTERSIIPRQLFEQARRELARREKERAGT